MQSPRPDLILNMQQIFVKVLYKQLCNTCHDFFIAALKKSVGNEETCIIQSMNTNQFYISLLVTVTQRSVKNIVPNDTAWFLVLKSHIY